MVINHSQCLNILQLHLDRINTFPEGYKTVVGERGLKLSGGEKVPNLHALFLNLNLSLHLATCGHCSNFAQSTRNCSLG